MKLKTFKGIRLDPPETYLEKGISNGADSPDYEGVIFSDGTTVVRWRTLPELSIEIFATFDAFFKIHGHPEYMTHILWD